MHYFPSVYLTPTFELYTLVMFIHDFFKKVWLFALFIKSILFISLYIYNLFTANIDELRKTAGEGNSQPLHGPGKATVRRHGSGRRHTLQHGVDQNMVRNFILWFVLYFLPTCRMHFQQKKIGASWTNQTISKRSNSFIGKQLSISLNFL